MDKTELVYQIFKDAGFTDLELGGAGILGELLETSEGLTSAYSPAWSVKLSIDEARCLLDRLERSAVMAARKEYENETAS